MESMVIGGIRAITFSGHLPNLKNHLSYITIIHKAELVSQVKQPLGLLFFL